MAKEKKYSGYGYHGGGRKAKAPGKPRLYTMSIVVSEEERTWIREQAIKANKSQSAWILENLRRGK